MKRQMEKEKNIQNGSMTLNMEDVIALGKQMERMRDGKDLAEDERVADPIQFTDKEYQEKEE